MEKIGIITFHNSNNYGAILQTYALQTIYLQYSDDVEIIDYIDPEKKGWYKAFDFSKKKTLFQNFFEIVKLPNAFIIAVKNYRLNKFTKRNYRLSEETFEGMSQKLNEYVNNFGIISVGSDQVWNWENTSFDKVYFLDFKNCKAKLISYAASFGMSTVPNDKKLEYKRLLSRFDDISVRESDGEKILSDLGINKKVSTVLDPTLLISSNTWLKSVKREKINKNYILMYSIGKNHHMDEIARSFSKATGLRIIRIATNLRDWFGGFKTVNPGIDKFINLFYDATYVFTDSFHGVAFSLNFNKKFFVFLRDDNKANNRIMDLLSKVNMENTRVHIYEDINLSLKYNYEYANNQLKIMKLDSMNYIEKAISNRDL
ncbi:polysaccharide pyruvyl transferase family protein [Companilactobacillus allii]|uniref:Polysaccharide pyruvyl transferase domain-containing protein n=1 Tax=Companilactobacillus allii TaxID=1847728 RepID=A0A1P8Q2B4_9LACO|nr:polysaccharide pyruvyl transferase family protein [Companilactobacillus allii]APX71957.1 hypothetical protein BTM29_05030 [Companilactobacillus allii]USQ69053.1 polysaccharide pyruvyl transferase family protein [Companilactobacillus allii]